MGYLNSIIEFIFLLIIQFPNWLIELTKALTWPVVALIALWIIRRPLCIFLEKIPTIVDRLQELPGLGKLTNPQADISPKPTFIEKSEVTIEDINRTEEGHHLISGDENIKKCVQNLFPNEDIDLNIHAFEDIANKTVTNTDESKAKFYLYGLSVAANFLAHERNYRSIFGSQISLLRRLIVSPLKVEDTYYNYQSAAKIHSEFYKEYSFENWLNYLINTKLCTRHENTISITKSGHSFLHYLVNNNISEIKPY